MGREGERWEERGRGGREGERWEERGRGGGRKAKCKREKQRLY